jgi:conjugative transposon TraM protein
MLFPFWSLFYYAFSQFRGKPKQEVKFATVDSTSINPAIPDVGSDVSANNLPDKFKAFQDTYKQQADSTAVKSLSPDNFQHSYEQDAAEEKSKRFLDSMTQVMNRHNAEFSTKMGETDRLSRPSAAAAQTSPEPVKERPADEMETFKKQMAFIDSMQRVRQEALNPARQTKPAATPPTPDTVKALSVDKADAVKRQAFNTVFANTEKNFISAIIDEETKSMEGSRIRFRLLDDIMVGNNQLVEKGTYIYGFVTGFTAQRLIITITSINHGNEMLPVKLSVYDNDGLKGLYVPASEFRDFTKDLGAGSASAISYNSSSTSTDPLSQITTGFIQQLFSGTTSAAQRLLKTNKAVVKYSTVVWLLPEKH